MQPTHTKIWDIDYWWSYRVNGRAATGFFYPNGSSNGCYAGTVGATSTCSRRCAPATDGVRDHTLGAGDEGVAHVHLVTNKL